MRVTFPRGHWSLHIVGVHGGSITSTGTAKQWQHVAWGKDCELQASKPQPQDTGWLHSYAAASIWRLRRQIEAGVRLFG